MFNCNNLSFRCILLSIEKLFLLYHYQETYTNELNNDFEHVTLQSHVHQSKEHLDLRI